MLRKEISFHTHNTETTFLVQRQLRQAGIPSTHIQCDGTQAARLRDGRLNEFFPPPLPLIIFYNCNIHQLENLRASLKQNKLSDQRMIQKRYIAQSMRKILLNPLARRVSQQKQIPGWRLVSRQRANRKCSIHVFY